MISCPCWNSKTSRGKSVLGGVLEHQKRHFEYHMIIFINIHFLALVFLKLCVRLQLHSHIQNLQNVLLRDVLRQSVCSGMDGVDCTLAFAASTPP